MRIALRIAVLPALLFAAQGWAVQSCSDASDCFDGNTCTTDACVGNVCTWTADTPCGPFLDFPVAGKKIKLRIPPTNPTANAFKLSATDGQLNIANLPYSFSADNPYHTGGSLRIFTMVGDGFDHTYPLPALAIDDRHWEYFPFNAPGLHGGYQYEDTSNQVSQIGFIKIVAGKTVKMKGKDNMPFTLNANPDPVQVVLTLGRYRYCWSMGTVGGDSGTRSLFKPGILYWAKNTVEPVACP